jgi:hypothetical protein
MMGIYQTGNYHMTGTIDDPSTLGGSQPPLCLNLCNFVSHDQQVGTPILGTIETRLQAVNILQQNGRFHGNSYLQISASGLLAKTDRKYASILFVDSLLNSGMAGGEIVLPYPKKEGG